MQVSRYYRPLSVCGHALGLADAKTSFARFAETVRLETYEQMARVPYEESMENG